MLCAGPYFALERRRVGSMAPMTVPLETAVILSNAGAPVTVTAGRHGEHLGRARTLLLPAALERLGIGGPADVLLGYLPDLEADIRRPLLAAGRGPVAVAALGEGLDGS
ncbi:phosphomannose isomerase [Streptantibioticus cattleyicolor NRRL 8057 = DSM 46488]|uniref:Phosphomannose isomerase n=1 Tax=Streptantibioticus cattleyicolor (strain ATCC 35852 / DSM 46488 / JCM 4925 / NBRC 14057 / NRRL 8057) TaxID=1003195 RepID=G8WY71_STREN|nr:phosphomannose isomerase [Streptantibioticus cattleyicolor NRRL 8057 = DSM 46488]